MELAMFCSWLNGEPGTGGEEKTWAVVIAAMETVKGKIAGFQEDVRETLGGTSVAQSNTRHTRHTRTMHYSIRSHVK